MELSSELIVWIILGAVSIYLIWQLFLYVLYKVVYVASSAITEGKKNTKNTGIYENND